MMYRIKKIKKHPKYVIDTSGNVFRESLSDGKIAHDLLKWDVSNGYARVRLDGINEYVGRLVLETFDPISDEDEYRAFYIDGNQMNNCIDNLTWATPSEIAIYSLYTIEYRKHLLLEKQYLRGVIEKL